jgi:hypothetical protein
MKDLIQKLMKWLLFKLAEESTFQQFAEIVLELSRFFFREATAFIEALVEKQQIRIDQAKEAGEPEEVIAELKAGAEQVTDKVMAREFSGSPVYVPRFIRRGIRDAKAYLLNHPRDGRNEIAREHGFFTDHDSEETRKAVEQLNKGFIDR